MPYESKIRPHNADRVTKNTTISRDLLNQIKEIANNMQVPFNQLLAEGIDYVLDTYKKPKEFKAPVRPKDRIQMGTTFSHVQYELLKDRARRLHTHTNTLIEIGMEFIIDKYRNV
ncbi:hypothetical protein RGU12_02260 [Fredinandcohnia sp. QZ13]|uniref:hypothetical protein n=1 Tax=Fredinandcohnia sp. QZ13 TaxID=3073144 RepID=UPI0028534CD5|nr:hypothetical protein [Fredinandcohnia sp. QZ13]MDR4886366.1 hypothetical protein [Fredinandcohnia sp. QZ13]